MCCDTGGVISVCWWLAPTETAKSSAVLTLVDTSVGDCESNHLPSIFNFTSNTVVQPDVDQLASWGIDLLKVDSCRAHPPRDPLSMWDGFNRTYPAIGKSLLAAGLKHNRTILYSCSWPAYTQGDELPQQYRLMAKHCNTWRNWDDVQPHWNSAGPEGGPGVSGIIDYWAG